MAQLTLSYHCSNPKDQCSDDVILNFKSLVGVVEIRMKFAAAGSADPPT